MIRQFVVASTLALLSLGHLGCSGQSRPVTGVNPPVTTERLSGHRLVDIKNDLSWQFSATEVVIENGGENLPTYLFEDLGLDAQESTKVEAKWRFDGDRGLLILSEVAVDGEPTADSVQATTGPAGPIRVNIGQRQYNIFSK